MRGKRRRDLSDEAYVAVRLAVLKRDGWRCQRCGGRTQLDVHHISSRARGGADTPENLIVLCRRCHRMLHEGRAPHTT
jgi:5-methylcytosine-specific restriction endonuclease McrA